MLASVDNSWIGLSSALAALIVISLPLLFRGIRSTLAEHTLLHGRRAVPGFKATPALGDRITGVEASVETLVVVAHELTVKVDAHGQKLDLIVHELSTDNGDSFRDHIEQAEARAERSAANAANTAAAVKRALEAKAAKEA